MRTLEQDLLDRYQNVRASFIQRGTSFNAWCKANSIAPQNARKALLGLWTGKKASHLVKRILDASGTCR